MLEMMTSVLIISLVLGAVFTFLYQTQRRFQASGVTAESNQGARSAMQAMAQEIGQAGFNPQYTTSATSTAAITPSSAAQCITLNSINGINPGDWVSVDSGAPYEQVKVLATSNAALSGYTVCSSANQISAVFEQCHNNSVIPCPCGALPTPAGCPPLATYPVVSYKMPYPGGILQNQSVSYGGSNVTLSNDHILGMFYGDTNNSGNVWYVVYSLYNPNSSGSLTSVSIKLNGTPTTFYLYTLYRSITQANFATGQTVNHTYPLVNNVLYQSLSGANPVGPTGQPLFSYPSPVQVDMVPSTISVVGTLVINISVAVNPSSLETPGIVQWYTMASQIRPVNLWAAVTANQTGGGRFLPPTPLGVPMSFPSTLSNYYF